MTEPYDTAHLQRAWRELAERVPPGEDCPPPARIWEAVRGALAPGATRELVEHVATCPACAEAWQLARELGSPLPAEASTRIASRARRWSGAPHRWGRYVAAAATLVLAVTFGWRYIDRHSVDWPGGDTIERGAPKQIEPQVPDGSTLSRRAFLLAWDPGPEGATYEVLVTRPDLTVVDRASGLDEPRYRVPAPALEGVDENAELLWRVEMTLPSGRRVASPAFRVYVR